MRSHGARLQDLPDQVARNHSVIIRNVKAVLCSVLYEYLEQNKGLIQRLCQPVEEEIMERRSIHEVGQVMVNARLRSDDKRKAGVVLASVV